MSEDTHVGLQSDLRRVITEYITENVKGAHNVQFLKFWTETLKENKIKATFAYTFDEDDNANPEAARVGVEGHAILNRAQGENGEFDLWNLDELHVSNNTLLYKEGMTVRPGK